MSFEPSFAAAAALVWASLWASVPQAIVMQILDQTTGQDGQDHIATMLSNAGFIYTVESRSRSSAAQQPQTLYMYFVRLQSGEAVEVRVENGVLGHYDNDNNFVSL